MKPERWDQLAALFERVRALSPGARAAFLDEACPDADFRADLESLLSLAAEAPEYLDDLAEGTVAPMMAALVDQQPGDEEEAAQPSISRTLSHYRLLKKLGEGGMGTVVLAERDVGAYRQQVALKFLRPGLDEDARRRFRTEQQILAALSHPGIARLLDGGFTDDGRPFLAMEYVLGEPINQYSDHHLLPVRERLTLFVTVCEIVQYAHRNLVVHRDLKPSNILVTGEGEVKLLDFGIAKLLDEEVTPGPAPQTRTGRSWMTTEYAAPEQIRGEAVTTAADIYQLGVVLYELLTGDRPFKRGGKSLHAIGQAVLYEEPVKPSTAIAHTRLATGEGISRIEVEQVSRARATQPERLQRLLRGDLDMIVLKALRKEPEERYASAEAFAEDVRRYLSGVPVKARQGTLGYRARKFVRRHRWGVAAAVLIVGSLVLGVAGMAWQAAIAAQERDRARDEAAKARQVTDFMMNLFEAGTPWEALGDTLTARELLTLGVERAEALGGQPDVQAQLLTLMGRIYAFLGHYDQAEPFFRRALALRRTYLGEEHPDVAESLTALARLLGNKGEYKEIEQLYLQALEIERTVLGEEHPDVAQTLYHLSRVPGISMEEKIALNRQAIAVRRKALGPAHPLVAHDLSGLAALLRIKGDYEQAEALLREALSIHQQAHGPEHLRVARTMIVLGILLRHKGDLDDAEALHRRALAMQHKLLGAEHPDLVGGLNTLAEVLIARGNVEEAEALLREALAIRERAYGPEHPLVVDNLAHLAGLLQDHGGLEEAEQLQRRVLAIQREQLGPEHTHIAGSLHGLARILVRKGAYEDAEALLHEAVNMRRKLLGPNANVGLALRDLARLERRKGTYAAAESFYKQALDNFRERGISDRQADVQEVYKELGALYAAWGKPEQAARYRALLAAPNEQ